MKRLIKVTAAVLFVSILSLQNFANANLSDDKEGGGTGVGNGGDVVVCKKGDWMKLDILDLFEGRQIQHIEPIFHHDMKNYLDMAREILGRMSAFSAKKHESYMQRLAEFPNEVYLANDKLKDIPDAGDLKIPADCTVEQIAIRIPSRIPYGKLYYIYKPYWDLLTEENKAILVAHEVIFADEKDGGQQNSVRAREINAVLFGDMANVWDESQILAWVKKIGITDFNAWWCTSSYDCKTPEKYPNGRYKVRPWKESENPLIIQDIGEVYLKEGVYSFDESGFPHSGVLAQDIKKTVQIKLSLQDKAVFTADMTFDLDISKGRRVEFPYSNAYQRRLMEVGDYGRKLYGLRKIQFNLTNEEKSEFLKVEFEDNSLGDFGYLFAETPDLENVLPNLLRFISMTRYKKSLKSVAYEKKTADALFQFVTGAAVIPEGDDKFMELNNPAELTVQNSRSGEKLVFKGINKFTLRSPSTNLPIFSGNIQVFDVSGERVKFENTALNLQTLVFNRSGINLNMDGASSITRTYKGDPSLGSIIVSERIFSLDMKYDASGKYFFDVKLSSLYSGNVWKYTQNYRLVGGSSQMYSLYKYSPSKYEIRDVFDHCFKVQIMNEMLVGDFTLSVKSITYENGMLTFPSRCDNGPSDFNGYGRIKFSNDSAEYGEFAMRERSYDRGMVFEALSDSIYIPVEYFNKSTIIAASRWQKRLHKRIIYFGKTFLHRFVKIKRGTQIRVAGAGGGYKIVEITFPSKKESRE